jgi:hypothetical protein
MAAVAGLVLAVTAVATPASAADFVTECPYELKDGVVSIWIRSSPRSDIDSNKVGVWYAGEVKYMGSPAHFSGTWREMAHVGWWVYSTYIQATGNPCRPV